MFNYKYIDKKNSLTQLFDVYKKLKQQDALYDEGFIRRNTLKDFILKLQEEFYGGPGSIPISPQFLTTESGDTITTEGGQGITQE